MDDLPLEVTVHVLSFLSPTDVAKGVLLTCKSLCEVAQNDSLWKLFCCSSFPVFECDYKKPDEFLWRQLFGFFEKTCIPWRQGSPGVELSSNGHTVTCLTTTLFPLFKVILGTRRLTPSWNYFQVKILQCSYEEREPVDYITYGSGESKIGIGVASLAEASHCRFLGFDLYAGGYFNDGKVGCAGTTAQFSRPYKTGDVVGVEMDFSTLTVNCFLNGEPVGRPYGAGLFLRSAFFPAVCLRGAGDAVMMMLPKM